MRAKGLGLNRWVLGLPLLLLLGSCSDVFFHQSYWVRLDPPQLGYQVQEDKIEIVGNQAFVEVARGAPGGWLERYEYVYVDDSGNEILPGASLGSGSVGLPIPPGREEVPGGGINYKEARSEPFRFSLDGRVAAEHLAQGSPLNWRARVTWYVRTENGTPVVWTQEYQIKFPLK